MINTFSIPVPFLCMIFAEIIFCSSINLEQAVMVLVLFFLPYQLSCGMRYLILSVPMSFTGFRRESRAAFCTAAFLFNEYIFKYYVFSRYLYSMYAMYFSCKCNVSKILAPAVIREKLMTVCMLPLGGRMRTLCNLRLQCLPYDR